MAKEAPPPVSRPAGTGQAHAHALAFLMTVIIATSFPLGEHITHGLDLHGQAAPRARARRMRTRSPS